MGANRYGDGAVSSAVSEGGGCVPGQMAPHGLSTPPDNTGAAAGGTEGGGGVTRASLSCRRRGGRVGVGAWGALRWQRQAQRPCTGSCCAMPLPAPGGPRPPAPAGPPSLGELDGDGDGDGRSDDEQQNERAAHPLARVLLQPLGGHQVRGAGLHILDALGHLPRGARGRASRLRQGTGARRWQAVRGGRPRPRACRAPAAAGRA